MKLKHVTIENKTLVFTALSFLAVFIIFINTTFAGSPVTGLIALSIYFLINSTFWGNAFFEEENILIKLAMGSLLVVAFIALIGWLILIIYNLNILNTVLALSIVAILPLLMKIMYKHGSSYEPPKPLKRGTALIQRFVRFLYVSMTVLSFYLLYIARADEVYTVWQYMHPLFLPLYFATTFLLLLIVFSTDKIEYKLLFIMIHSILSHSFFAIIFPAGDIGYQARILAVTRSLFDNNVLHGWPPKGANNFLSQIWHWFRGTNFQSALSIIFARALNIDVTLVHLFLVPILWGAFTPIAAFMITKTIFYSEKIALLSSFTISFFPSGIYYGAVSIPNSLGYVFFLFSLFFTLKYLRFTGSSNTFLMLTFFLVSFLAHFLTGTMAFSLFLFAIALKTFVNHDKDVSIFNLAKPPLVLSFLLAISIIPLALVYQRLFIPYRTTFTLYRFHKLPLLELVLLFIFGKYVDFWIFGAIAHLAAPIFGLLGIIHCLSNNKALKGDKYLCLFLILSLLIVAADYRILKLLMIRVPFNEERLWMFRDLLITPFIATITYHILTRLHKNATYGLQKIRSVCSSLFINKNLKVVTLYIVPTIYVVSYVLTLLLFPAWIALSTYFGYPRYSPLQITSYELEAAIYINKNDGKRYVVICDVWFGIAGQIVVGLYNPHAYYFRPTYPQAWSLFMEMKNNPTAEIMIKAMEQTNATTAYFVIQKPRLGEEKYNQIVMQAIQNGLQTYHLVKYKGEEKLRIFVYEKQSQEHRN
jgi:hypothetical protein